MLIACGFCAASRWAPECTCCELFECAVPARNGGHRIPTVPREARWPLGWREEIEAWAEIGLHALDPAVNDTRPSTPEERAWAQRIAGGGQ